MADTVKLPGLGNVDKKWVYASGAAVVGIVGVAWWRRRQAAASAATTTAPTDTSALGDTTPVGPGGAQYPTDQYGNTLPAPIAPSQSPGIVTNLDWLGQGESLSLGGIPADTISRALTKVLGGIAVTQAEADIFHQVVGIIGNPPQGHPPLKLVTIPQISIPKIITRVWHTRTLGSSGWTFQSWEHNLNPGVATATTNGWATQAVGKNRGVPHSNSILKAGVPYVVYGPKP